MIAMSLQDASFLQVESPLTPAHIAYLMTFSPPQVPGDDYIKKLFSVLLGATVDNPPFNYRLAQGLLKPALPRWEIDQHIDPAYHLRHESVIQPGGERELGMLVSRLHSTALDRKRPLWEMTLIEGLSGGRFALYFKVHHALADGVRLLRLALSGLTSNPEGVSSPPWTRLISEPANSQEKSPVANEWLDFLGSMAKDISQGKSIRPQFPDAPQSMLNGPVTSQRRLATQRLSLDRVKQVARSVDATVNDVVLAACSGALRTYLQRMDALPGQSLVAGIPVALPNHESLVSGNALGGITVYLATDIDDPAQRLAAIKTATTKAKAAVKRIPTSINKGIGAMANLLSSLPTASSKTQRNPVTNVTISNVPGPQEPLYMQGALLESIFPATLLMPGQRLSIMLTGYRGELHFGFVGCPDYLPHLQQIAELLPTALEELQGLFDGNDSILGKHPAGEP